MSDLEKIRDEIDLIDEKLVELFEKRMGMVRDIATHKEKLKQPILHEDREKEVLANCKAKLKDKNFENEVEELFKCVMMISKKIQIELLNNNKDV